MRTRSLVTAIATAGILTGGLGIAGCSSSSGGGHASTAPSVATTGSHSAAPTSGTSSDAAPPMDTFAGLTQQAYQKLAVPLAKMPGVNNVTFYPKTHSLAVYYKNAATAEQHAAVAAAVKKQHGTPSPSPSQ